MMQRLKTAALCGCLALSACRPEAPPPAAPTGAAEVNRSSAPAGVRWVAPAPAEGSVLTEAAARVLSPPAARAAIATPFPARVATVRVRAGERVTKDQILMEVLMPDVVRAAGALQASYTRVQAYQKQVTQLSALAEQGMTRLSELGEAQTHLAEARAEVQSHSAVLRSAGLEPGEAAEIAGRGVVALRSPIDGIVVELNASPGEFGGSSGEVLARVAAEAEGDRIEARLPHAPPSDAGFQYLPPVGAPVPLRLVGRAPMIDPRDATVTVWFEPAEGSGSVRGGETGRLLVRAGEELAALKVPARALTFIEGRPHLFLRRPDGGDPLPLAVEVVALTGTDALVQAEGFTPDARVAADASAFETPGQGHHHD